jgi:beta-lactam-binding protein with PASTA domain
MQASTLILISFVTSLVTAISTVYVVERYDIVGPGAPAETVVPNFKGLTEADARSSASAANLLLTVSGTEATTEAKPNTVLRQSLPAGQKVPLKHPVSIVVAEELPTVPTLTGLSVEAATARLKQAGYTLQIAGPIPDAEIPVDKIARQLPSADEAYVRGAAVTVQLSSGPADVEIPKFVGRPYTEAMKEAESLGLKPVVAWISRGETPEYVILQQSAAPGDKVEPGSVVRFTVNR